MATAIKRIEKDFLLKVLFDEQVPLMLRFNRQEYVLFTDKAPKFTIELKPNKSISGLREGNKVELIFDYRSQTITFTAPVQEIREDLIVLEAPEFLYKNLDRAFSRVAPSSDLKVSFCFRGERYSLGYPRTEDFEPARKPDYSPLFDSENIKDLVNQLSAWARTVSSEHKLVMFKDNPPKSIEEKIISATGKALFIPSTLDQMPQIDLSPKPRLITEELFRKFSEGNGTDSDCVTEALAQFLAAKVRDSVLSDVWVPILFHEYVIGYIRLWIKEPQKPPFDLDVVDALFQFGKILTWSLKENGYFKPGEIKKELYPGKVIDVSASGLLFAHPFSPIAEALLPDSELDIQIDTGKRTVRTASKVVRRYKDTKSFYFGCRYTEIAPEDLRYLFEFIYGKQLTDADSSFLNATE